MDEAAVRAALTRVGDLVGGRRRLLAAALAAISVVAAIRAATPTPAATAVVLAAAHDLTGGTPLVAADLRREALPIPLVPVGAITAESDAVGRLLAAPVRRGEPLTDVRLLGPSLLSALPDPGLVATPVRVADGSAAAALVHAGDLVDVLTTRDAGSASTTRDGVLVRGARVLSVPAARTAGDPAGDPAGLVIIAVSPADATVLARAAATTRLTLVLEH